MSSIRKFVLSASPGLEASDLLKATLETSTVVHPSRRGVVCMEVAPNMFLGLTNERRSVSLLEVDENLFIFAPRRLSSQRLKTLIERLLQLYVPQQDQTEEVANSAVKVLLEL